MELLLPAGSPDKLRYALHYGADAVYVGGDAFSLRTRAENFDQEKLEQAISLTRKKGKKFYLAVNSIIRERDYPALKRYLERVLPLKPDAVIASDLGVVRFVREHFSDIEIHISTQASVSNSGSVAQLRDMGVRRVVLARELSLRDIREIKERVPEMELEVFVHGAMCVAYSGRCLLSHYLTSPAFLGRGEEQDSSVTRIRSANMGDCSHTCRWEFTVSEARRNGEVLDAELLDKGTLLFSSKDLCLIRHLKELKEAGVDSLKVEGRMKSILYVATTARVYRDAVDLVLAGNEPEQALREEWDRELVSISRREYTTGFIFEDNDALLPYEEPATALARYLGTVLEKTGDGYLCRSSNRIDPGMALEVIGPGMRRTRGFVYSLCDEAGGELDFVRHSTVFLLKTEADLKPMDIIRIPG